MEVIPAMFNRLTWFVKEPSLDQDKTSEPKSGPATARAASPQTTTPGTSNTGYDKTSSAKTAAAFKTATKSDDAAQRGRKRIRSTEAPKSSNQPLPGPIVTLLVPASPLPISHDRNPIPATAEQSEHQHAAAGDVNGRKVLVPTRFSQRLENKAGSAGI